MKSRLVLPLTVVALAAVVVVGCGSPAPEFRRYATYARKMEGTIDETFRFTAEQRQNVDTILTSLYGTPDQPSLPKLDGIDLSSIVDLPKLQMAAGAVGSDESGRPRGLYREHCAHCHGVSGDGAGPTAAFLNPYPRDYRPGIYKFKSTPVGSKPTRQDLHKIVYDGIPGTAMPSFKLLPADELDALVHYVRYLSLRGETERNLLTLLTEVDEGQPIVDVHSKDSELQQEQLAMVKEVVAQIAERWISAEEAAVEIPTRPASSAEELVASRQRGRDLFYGAGQCIKCHGESALGDGQTNDYDNWAKEFMVQNQPESVAPYVALGLLEPRNIRPRNLRLGVFRGGHRPIDIFWRVKLGIEGTPMPAAPAGLTDDQIWDLVNYVQSLPYEKINDPRSAVPENLRERM